MVPQGPQPLSIFFIDSDVGRANLSLWGAFYPLGACFFELGGEGQCIGLMGVALEIELSR